jgi:hypothetical protein
MHVLQLLTTGLVESPGGISPPGAPISSRSLVGLYSLVGLPHFPLRDLERLCLVHELLLLPDGLSWPVVSAEQRNPFAPPPLQRLHLYLHSPPVNLACRDLVPAFPQRSPPWYLATAACGGLRSAHDCQPRRALLHHSHSWAPPIRRRRFRVTRHIAVATIAHPASAASLGVSGHNATVATPTPASPSPPVEPNTRPRAGSPRR